MKAELIFLKKKTYPLKFGGSVTVYMDCYRVKTKDLDFESTFRFSFIAFDPLNPDRRILVDQHRGRPCHLHIEDREVTIDPPLSLDIAIEIFETAVQKYFGRPK